MPSTRIPASQAGAQLRRAFAESYARHCALFSCIHDENLLASPNSHRRPLIFYLGHGHAITSKLLGLRFLNNFDQRAFEPGVSQRPVDAAILAADRAGTVSWPSPDALRSFGENVRRSVASLHLDGFSAEASQKRWALGMACAHEDAHFENATVLLREMPTGSITRSSQWKALYSSCSSAPHRFSAPARAAIDDLITIVSADSDTDLRTVHLGRGDHPGGGELSRSSKRSDSEEDVTFGWDNEWGRSTFELSPFALTQRLVSNADFALFIESGGYANVDLWDKEGWAWCQSQRAEHPLFWIPVRAAAAAGCDVMDTGPHALRSTSEQHASDYQLRTVHAVVSMRWDLPAELNLHESRAYAKWVTGITHKSYRVPSEAELRFAVELTQPPAGQRLVHVPIAVEFGEEEAWAEQSQSFVTPFPGAEMLGGTSLTSDRIRGEDEGDDWDDNKEQLKQLLSLERRPDMPFPVDDERSVLLLRGEMPMYGMRGSVWQWSDSEFAPFNGFTPDSLYKDFSTPYFDGKHFSQVGGSWATHGYSATETYRVWWRPDFQQHCGLRLAVSL